MALETITYLNQEPVRGALILENEDIQWVSNSTMRVPKTGQPIVLLLAKKRSADASDVVGMILINGVSHLMLFYKIPKSNKSIDIILMRFYYITHLL